MRGPVSELVHALLFGFFVPVVGGPERPVGEPDDELATAPAERLAPPVVFDHVGEPILRSDTSRDLVIPHSGLLFEILDAGVLGEVLDRLSVLAVEDEIVAEIAVHDASVSMAGVYEGAGSS